MQTIPVVATPENEKSGLQNADSMKNLLTAQKLNLSTTDLELKEAKLKR